MPLFKFSNLNKYGNIRSRILHRESSQFSINPKGFGKFIGVQRFKYDYTHPVLPPSLFTTREGKKYIVPAWTEVHPETTLEDINWIKPKLTNEPKAGNDEWLMKSSSSDSIYRVKKHGERFTCNCSGFWRALDREKGCKHVQEVRKKLQVT